MRRATNTNLIETPTIDQPAVEENDTVAPAEQDTTPGSSGEAYRVILYNDDFHGQDEVVEQLYKATKYPIVKCWAIMMEADRKGRAICYHGSRERCHQVTKVLREIRLQCEVDCD